MGLFGGDRIISVDSVVYNMAGPEENRPNYLKSLVSHNVLSGTKDSMGDTLNNGYLHGPGIKTRGFYRWARNPDHYGAIGLPTGDMTASDAMNPDLVAAEIPVPVGSEAWVQTVTVEPAVFGYWAERYIFDNYPARINTNWKADFNNVTKIITITWEDASTSSFTATGYVASAKYVYAYYSVVTGSSFGNAKLYIYRIGSGNPDLDALVRGVHSFGEFFPFIPVRLDNKFVAEDYLPEIYEQSKKAYSKMTGGRFDELIEKVADNENLADIDYTYVQFGVSLNVIDNSAKKYLYRFFEKLQAFQSGGPLAYTAWKNSVNQNQEEWAVWQEWYSAQGDADNALHGTPEPPRPLVPSTGQNYIRIASTASTFIHYDMRLNWHYIAAGTSAGKGKPGAKPGELWFQVMGQDTVAQTIFGVADGTHSLGLNIDKVRLYWQRDNDTYTYLDIVGLQHSNYIYGSHAVTISAAEAIADLEESGFIVPLHYDTYKEISLVDASQMATASVFLVFNCYKIKKTKWYESGFFMFILVIVVAIVSAVFTGGASIGLLGTAMGVGTAMGLTGMTAAIVGSIVNAIAAMMLTTIISQFSTALFGEQIGAFVAAITMLVIGNFMSSTSMGMAFDWGSILQVDNLIALTNSLLGGISNSINAATIDIGNQMVDYAEQAKIESNNIQQAFFQSFGYGAGQINPLMFVDSATNMTVAESSDTFLTRTLMTGSEIAELSRDMLYNFSDYTLKLPNAFT